MNKQQLLKAYNKLKLDLDKDRHSETLRKYKILSKAYKLGTQIYGKNSFSVMKLSLDFDIPYTTCKRILSLNKANNKTWKLINEGKITSFKVAQVLLKKNHFYQDEAIKLIIDENLSTYQIYSLKIGSLEDIKKARLEISIKNGFARASTAYYSFNHTLERLEQLLVLDKKFLPKDKIPLLNKKLIKISKQMNQWESK
ncbi:MAG TPA: hypothetical protein VMZ91_05710 [Candidatus Paceibacterota bacterium]|nr:hypothetical protein [Candidatus Paceibacterota bacterium]